MAIYCRKLFLSALRTSFCISLENAAVFQLSRTTLSRLRSPGIFSFSRCSLLNSISPFFIAPSFSIPASNVGGKQAAVFGADDYVAVVVAVVLSRLSWNVDRRREQKTAILKRRLSSCGFPCLSPSSPSSLSLFLFPFSNIAARLLSHLSYFSFLTRLRESHHFQSITSDWLLRSRKMQRWKAFLSLSLSPCLR